VLPLRIGQIFDFDRQCLYLTPTFGVNSGTLDCEIWPQKPETSLCSVVDNIFRYLNLLGVDHQCDRENYDRLTTRAKN